MSKRNIKPIFYGIIKEGPKVEYEKPKTLKAYLESLEGKEVQVKIERKKNKRTLPENNYYWGVIITLLAEEFGYTDPEEMHDRLLHKFLRKKDKNGFDTTWRTSDEEFTTEMAEKYYSDIRMWASCEYGIYIPLPNEAYSY